MTKTTVPLIADTTRNVTTSTEGLQSLVRSRNAEPNNLETAKKRLYFNGSSYSGADIKVVVHRYNAGPDAVLPEIQSAIAVYTEVQTIIDTLRSNSLPAIQNYQSEVKSGSMDYDTFRDLFNSLWNDPISHIRIKEQVLLGSTYHQFIGQRLASLTVAVQEYPESVNIELFAMRNLLFKMVASWQDLARAIEARTGPKYFFQTKTLAEIQTLSVSTYREKAPVRGFGAARVKGYVRGTRSVAGTMIFTVFDRNVFLNLLDIDPTDFDADDKFTAAIMDQMPPIDISILFANEYGSLSRMTLYGVEFVSEGQTMSIEDLLLEQQVQFIARDIDPMTPVLTEDGRPYSEMLVAYNQANLAARKPEILALRASDLVGSKWNSREGEDTADIRFRNRFNPFF